MDQYTCYECTGVVSITVKACPHCGAPEPGNGNGYSARTHLRELPEALDWAISKGFARMEER